MADDSLPRRRFLLRAGTAVAAGLAPAATLAQTKPAAPAPGTGTSEPESSLVLTSTETAFFSAAADCMIPADELSPSGTDCGVVTFIDRQLASAWGRRRQDVSRRPVSQGQARIRVQLFAHAEGIFLRRDRRRECLDA